MPSDNESKILPPMMNDRARPQANRTLLGFLIAILAVAVLLALWFLIFDRGDGSASSANTTALPTPVTIPTPGTEPTSTPVPAATTVEPAVTPSPVPAGFQACPDDRKPLTTTAYVVDTNTTPLNQRSEPAVSSAQAGTFAPGQDNLVFSGECLINDVDQYTWWKIFNGTEDVWVASDFVSPR